MVKIFIKFPFLVKFSKNFDFGQIFQNYGQIFQNFGQSFEKFEFGQNFRKSPKISNLVKFSKTFDFS